VSMEVKKTICITNLILLCQESRSCDCLVSFRESGDWHSFLWIECLSQKENRTESECSRALQQQNFSDRISLTK
jgi:hypothetical protein